MHEASLDRFSSLDSPVHRLSPAVKVGAAVGTVVAITVLPPRFWPGFVAAAAALAIVTWLSRIPIRFILKRLLLLQPFVIGVAVLSIFRQDGSPDATRRKTGREARPTEHRPRRKTGWESGRTRVAGRWSNSSPIKRISSDSLGG